MVVYFPFSKYSAYKTRVKRCGISFLLFCSLILYSFSLHTSYVYADEHLSHKKRCDTRSEWIKFLEKFSFIDILITILTPMFIILIVNVLISFKLMKASSSFKYNTIFKFIKENKSESNQVNERQESVQLTNKNHLNIINSSQFTISSLQESVSNNSSFRPSNNKTANRPIGIQNKIKISTGSKKNRNRTYSKTTRMLLIISTVFLFLNMPMTFYKFRYFINNLSQFSSTSQNGVDVQIQNYQGFKNYFKNASISSILNQTDLMEKISSLTNSISTDEKNTQLDQILERLAYYLYYLNYSINFILYTLNGSKFKMTLVLFLKNRFKKRSDTNDTNLRRNRL